MLINKTIIRELECNNGKPIPYKVKQYLLFKYADEPFPYEYSQQDLYANIQKEINDYECGSFNITAKDLSGEGWKEEREHLQGLYVEKMREIQDLQKYVSELEQILCKHNLKSHRMTEMKNTAIAY